MLMSASVPLSTPAAAQQAQKPNILFIMGDDIGWMQPSIYHQGLMVGETPNIDRIGNEGAKFMHYYAEQSCTAGRTPSSPACSRSASAWSCRNLPAAPPSTDRNAASAKFLLDRVNTGEFGKNRLGDHVELAADPRTASRNSGATSITSMRCKG